MRSTMLLFIVLINIFSYVHSVNKRFNRLEKRIFEGLDLDVFNSDMAMNKKSTETNFNILITIYDFMNREQLILRKDYYSILQRKISDLNQWREQGGNIYDLYLLPEELLEDREYFINNEKIIQLIKKETSMPESIEIEQDSEFYGHLNITRLVTNLFNNKRRYNFIYKNFYEASKFVAFNPNEIRLKNKPICIPVVTMLKIINTQYSNIVLNSVFSDRYQISIFCIGFQKQTYSSIEKNAYPIIISPGDTLIFQIIILPDTTGIIQGNIIFNFNKKSFILYPIQILVNNNQYRTKPLYHLNAQVSKLVSVPIEIYNPHNTRLVIKEIINSFASINIQWTNGQLISTNKTTFADSMMEIPPKEKLTLMSLNFLKDFEGVDYGLIQIKTDKDVLIIPILVSVEIRALNIYPTYLDFGLIDLSVKVNRLIPLTVTNTNSIPVQLLSIFSTFDDIIEFIPNLHHINFFNTDNNIEYSKDKKELNSCIIQPGEKVSILGYFLLNLERMKQDSTDEFCKYGSFIIQTNFTNNPFIEIEYSYCVTNNLFEYSVNRKNHRLDKNNFISLNYDLTTKYCLKFDINAKIKNVNSAFKPFFNDNFYYQYIEDNYNSGNKASLEGNCNIDDKYTKSIESILSINPIDNQNAFGETINLFFAIVNPNFLKRFYFIPFKSSIDNKYGIIPISIKTYSLDFIDCDNFVTFDDCMDNKNYLKENVARNVNLKETVFISDFETIQTANLKRKYFALLNQSDEDIYIRDMKFSSNRTLFELRSREKIQRSKDYVYQTDFSHGSGNYCQGVKMIEEWDFDPYECRIRPRTYFFFSVRIQSYIEENTKEYISFYFNKERKKFTLIMTVKFRTGKLSCFPMKLPLDPIFPGKVQTFTLRATSTFKDPIIFKTVDVSDERIFAYVFKENTVLMPNVTGQELMKLTINPVMQTNNKYFISDKSIIDYSSKLISYKDYYIWRENEKLWEVMKNNNQTTFDFRFRYSSSLENDLFIFARKTSIIKPRLTLEDEILFNFVKIGETFSKFIEVINPSDEDLSFELFLASEDFSEINQDDVFMDNNLVPKNGLDLLAFMDCSFLDFSDRYHLYDVLNDINRENSNINKNSYTNYILTKLPFVFELNESNSDGLSLTCKESDLIQIMLSNSSSKFKDYFTKSDRVICDLKIMRRIEMLNTFKHLGDLILPDKFNREIGVIRKMTDEELLIKKQTQERVTDKIPNSVNPKITESSTLKISKTSKSNQAFYIPKSVSSKVYTIKSKLSVKIGPIIFNPKAMLNSTAILFLKNNLTVLYPIKLFGAAATGILTFSEFMRVTNSTKLVKDKILKLEYDTLDKTQDFLVKVLRITNTGNVQLDVQKILPENESTSINLDYYGPISLTPQEKYDIKIFLIPDFNSCFFEKEIKFITDTNVYSLFIQVEINQEVFLMRNPLINFKIFDMSYHLYIIMAAIFITILKIIYIVSDEYKEIIWIREKKIICNSIYASSKSVINSNPELKLENLFLKSFRKSNQKFYDEFKIKEEEEEKVNESIHNKLKEKVASERERKLGEKVNDSSNILDAMLDKGNKNNIMKNSEIIENRNDGQKELTDNKNNKENIHQIKPIVSKKQNKISNKKPIGKNLIGLGFISNDKELKNEPEIIFKSKKCNLPKERDSNPSKNDSNSNGNISQNIQINPNKDRNNYSPWDKKRNSNPRKEADDNRVNNHSKSKRENIFQFSKISKNNKVAEPKEIKIVQNIPEILPQKKSEVEIIPNIPLILPEIKLIPDKVPTENTNHPEIQQLNNTIIADMGEKSFEEIFAEENILTNIGQKEGEEPLLINPTLNQQFLSFDPVFFAKDEKETSIRRKSKTNSEKSNEMIRFSNDKYIVYDVFAENEPKFENVFQIRNTISNKHNYNLFNKFANFEPVKPIKIKEEINKIDKDSEDGDEFLNQPRVPYYEDDLNSVNYQSEKDKLDSGAEEFKFNFKSIFTQNNVKLIDHTDYKEETTDNEEIQNDIKPYFNKNLIFPCFDFAQSQSGIFSSNPFASNSNRKLLDELREENIGEDYDDEDECERKNNQERNKNEDSEEDPEWANEIVDLNVAGYFDETGTFKLKN